MKEEWEKSYEARKKIIGRETCCLILSAIFAGIAAGGATSWTLEACSHKREHRMIMAQVVTAAGAAGFGWSSLQKKRWKEERNKKTLALFGKTT